MKRSETRKLDKEWSLKVRARYKFKCQMCGKLNKHNNAHHILPRTIKELRHDLRNGLCLCAYCHRWNKYLSPHQNALGFNKWLRTYHPKQWKWCMIAGGISKQAEPKGGLENRKVYKSNLLS